MNGKKLMLVVALVALVAMVGSSALAVDPVLDQSQETFSAGVRISAGQSACQTFTAGLTGNLAKFSIQFGFGTDQQAPATISIVGTTEGVPNGVVLWTSGDPSVLLTPGWLDVDTTTGAGSPFLTADKVYGIMVTSTDSVLGDPDDTWQVKTATNPYVSGQFFTDRGLGWTTANYPDSDATFRTYVLEWVPGDTNGDRVVDAADYIALKMNFGMGTGATVANGDFNDDGAVGWDDLQILMDVLSPSVSDAPASNTPEPATLGLLTIGALALIRRRHA